MIFNSSEFFLFLPVVFAVYWVLNRWTSSSQGLRLQNLFLLGASYLFYGWWEWRFLALIALSTAVDYVVGLRIAAANERELGANAPSSQRSRGGKAWLWVSVGVNLGLLIYFKYANFFIDSWINAWGSLGVPMHRSSLNVILPVGISFYTFQTLSYSIDIYRRQLKPTRDFISFAAFVSFFPQLVAGPIERASKLLPQIERRRTFDYDEAASGMKLILWGLFKKVVVADVCAVPVDAIYADHGAFDGPTLILGAALFIVQIYGDFSGYSDIAIGTARLFGVQLMTNFRTPFFARSLQDFWTRWHISLSAWFRDYVFTPMGGYRQGRWKGARNSLAVFLIIGLWHGANWTFVIWGGLNGLVVVIPLMLRRKKQRWKEKSAWPSALELGQMLSTFFIVTSIGVFFRSPDVSTAVRYVLGWFDWSGPWRIGEHLSEMMLLWVLVMLTVEWIGWHRCRGWVHEAWGRPWARGVRWGAYGVGIWLVLKGINTPQQFIYFQF